jgi:UDP-N-acetyl-D-mannosaminuronate dehydrogenase
MNNNEDQMFKKLSTTMTKTNVIVAPNLTLVTSILRSAIDGVQKTKIMYESFIAYGQLNEYLSVLVEKGLIEYMEGERIYRTTEKGIKFLGKNETSTEINKVLVVGLGQLGLPVAKYVKERGFDTYGYDISSKAMDRAQKIAGIRIVNDFNNSDFDVYILCVSTHKPNDIFTPHTEGLLSIAERISREAKRDGALVSIESTIPRGTSNKVFEILGHRLHVAHAPHRWYALEEKEHGVNQPRVIGGVCDCCLEAAMQFYNGIGYSSSSSSSSSSSATAPYASSINTSKAQKVNGDNNRDLQSSSALPLLSLPASDSSFLAVGKTRKSLGIPMHPVSKIEIAELSKIVENAHRYLQIAFAEDLYLYSQANNINFYELREALNTKWNVDILEPREGIGGHCLPKDTKMFLQSSESIKSKILTAAIEADRDYRQYRQSAIAEAAAIAKDKESEVLPLDASQIRMPKSVKSMDQ